MLKVEILIVIFLLLAKDFIMEGFVAQKTKFENKLDALFEIHPSAFNDLLSFRSLGHFFQLFVVKDQKDQHFVYRLNII